MPFEFLDPWHLFLPRGAGHVVSFYGGGGKTSLMRAFAGVLLAEGVDVVVTATTMCEVLHWPDLTVMSWADLEAGRARKGPLCYVHGGDAAPGPGAPDGKWSGLRPEQVDRLAEFFPDRVVLAEVDGSARRPVKLHRPDEPLWPRRTSLAVACVGLGAIGRPVAEILHRWDRAARPGLDVGDGEAACGWDLLEALLTGEGGYRELVPPETPTVLALLQMAECRDSIGLFAFLDRVMRADAFPVVAVGDVDDTAPEMRTAVLAEEPDGAER